MSTHIQWTVIGNNNYYYLNLTQNAKVMNDQDIQKYNTQCRTWRAMTKTDIWEM